MSSEPGVSGPALALLLERLALLAGAGAPSGTPPRIETLDRELLGLAERYVALSRVARDGAWIPMTDKLARTLLAALPEEDRAYLCQVEVKGTEHRWEAGDGNFVCRVVVDWPPEYPPSDPAQRARDGRYLVTREELSERLAASPSLGQWHAPVAARVAPSPDPDGKAVWRGLLPRWADLDEAISELGGRPGAETYVMAQQFRRIARVADTLERSWIARSTNRTGPGPSTIEWHDAEAAPAEFRSVTLWVMPAVPEGRRAPVPLATQPEPPEPTPPEPARASQPAACPIEPVIIRRTRGAGVVAIPWDVLTPSSFEDVINRIALELAKRKPGANPFVVWAWHSHIAGQGNVPALHLALTPSRIGGSTTMLKLCGEVARRSNVILGDDILEHDAAPVLVQSGVGEVLRIVEDQGGTPMVRQLSVGSQPTISFWPLDWLPKLDGVGVVYRYAKVDAR